MSEETKEEKVGFWGVIKSFFSNISLKAKLIIGALVGVFSFIALHMFRKNWNDKEILKLELEKVRAEIEIESAQKEIDINNEKLTSLEQRAGEIKKEIEKIEKEEAKRKEEADKNSDPNRKVSDEELDKFFDDRGF